MLARQLGQSDGVEKVSLYETTAFPPLRRLPYVKERLATVRAPRFDIVALIETRSPALAPEVQTTAAYRALVEALASQARQMHVMVTRNAKRIGDVDKRKQGVFAFNYFVADHADVMLRLWEYLAGWYAVETGLDNSTLLAPVDGECSNYVAINHARWDGSLLGFFLSQLAKKSFRSYMLANLEANYVGAMPVLYRLS